MTEIPPEVFETVAYDALREPADGTGGAVALEALTGYDVLLPALVGFHCPAGRPELGHLLLPTLE
ncbi:hypothetical protein AB0N07_11005 [Streptomyces sp. NPDC051172]|uniref:hypothetical protein n=1 Tax=Streptomyces sp. NPDC051172 TaxID=3155796 RepID=UPI003437B2C4